MKIIVSTHQGKLYDDEIDYVVVKGPNGEFGVLNNHIPIVCPINSGYLKLVLGNNELYLAVRNGVFEFKNNVATVIAQEAHIGRDKDSAFEHLDKISDERMEQNKKTNIDYTQKEKEILDNLRKAKVGQL